MEFENPMRALSLEVNMSGMNRLGLVLVLAGAVLVPAVLADSPGRHPRYLRARSDLRAAQYYLRIAEEERFAPNLRAAEREVEAAIIEIDHAAVLDRRDLDDHPRVDTNLDRPGRFGRIMALLRSAREDIDREEDNPAARRWRNAAFRHIDMAMDSVRRANMNLRPDRGYGPVGGPPGRHHPLYLRARSDLRAAQHYLRVTEEPNVTRHLRAAEREVEDAIVEIDRAAIIDRRDIDDHPRVDANLERLNRFQRIMALLRSARADIDREEDNPAARSWRNAAFRHIDAAMDSVRQAARDLRIDRSLGY